MQAHANDLRAEIADDPATWDYADADGFVHQFVDDWAVLSLDGPTRALLRYAEKLTAEPASMTEANVAELRSVGLSDEAIHDATQVIAYFNYINRVADALGVEVESDTPKWGGDRPSHPS